MKIKMKMMPTVEFFDIQAIFMEKYGDMAHLVDIVGDEYCSSVYKEFDIGETLYQYEVDKNYISDTAVKVAKILIEAGFKEDDVVLIGIC